MSEQMSLIAIKMAITESRQRLFEKLDRNGVTPGDLVELDEHELADTFQEWIIESP